MVPTQSTLRTRIYVDGYNLYYGCLRKTPYKWLDVKALFTKIISESLLEVSGAPARFALDPIAIKYFTAPILKNFARTKDSVSSQACYHNALRGHLGAAISIIEGYFDAKPARAYQFKKGIPARDCDQIDIWKLEEKQSDVALALHAYSDATLDIVKIDHVVIVSNDTDIVPCLELIRAHSPTKIGLIVPTRNHERNANEDLAKRADWIRTHILDKELAACQMPNMVKHNMQAIHKPLSWYPRPDLLTPILKEAIRVKKSRGAALKWMNTPCDHLDGQSPIQMTESDEGAAKLRTYMDKYATDFNI